jgi:hypothetical protein
MANVIPGSEILLTLMMEALSSYEMPALTRATWCNITEDAVLHYFDSLQQETHVGVALTGLIFRTRET